MSIPTIEQLRADAARGSVAAATAAALRLLVGRHAPFEPKEGIELLFSAAEREDPDALCQVATIRATGAFMPQSWRDALELLQHAAERGSVRAQGQLRILAHDRTSSDWGALRRRVDITAWATPPGRRSICEAPRIRAVDKFVPVAVCEWLMARGHGKYQASMMFDGQKSNFLASRTCSDFKFDIIEADCVLQVVRERVAAITGMPMAAFEPPQIFHYALGQEIKPHYDALRLGDGGYGQSGDYKGDRIATFLLYLNDDYDGGELEFPKVGLRHRGKAGDGVYFAHIDEHSVPDRKSLHAALPITRNEKFILSQWIHDRPFAASA
ncbi:MAG: 2OG-Fe(II) oxygenase [Alphaproteobacteria bacterium]|nr:2OG-Fe(II) oxygenase [Alphaproteobacteria bacterium]